MKVKKRNYASCYLTFLPRTLRKMFKVDVYCSTHLHSGSNDTSFILALTVIADNNP